MNTATTQIGYARTSTTDQNLDAQLIALKAAGCTIIRTEQKSGARLEGRPELRTILDFIHPGETLVVTRIDRLARSLSDLLFMKLRIYAEWISSTFDRVFLHVWLGLLNAPGQCEVFSG